MANFSLLLFKTLLIAYFYDLTHVQPHFWEALVKAFPMICLITDLT